MWGDAAAMPGRNRNWFSRRRSDRVGGGAKTRRTWGNAQPSRPAASPGRAERCRHGRKHATASRRFFRIPRSRRRRGQGHRREDAGLASAAPQRRREPFRSIAWIIAEPADRPRRRNRPAAAPLGARQNGRWAGRAGLRRARDRQVAHRRDTGGAPADRAASPTALLLLALSPGQRAVSVYRPAQPRRQPVVMVFEDVHWIDPTSRELLDLVVERVCSLPVLLIVTFRPEFQA